MKYLNTILSGIVIASIAGCSEKQAATNETVVPVKVITAGETSSGTVYNYVGTVEETKGSLLSFQVAGNVARVLVDVGDKVKKGQLLATVDPVALKNIHESQLATLNQARDAYNRYKKLHDQGSLPEIKWVEVETKLEQAVSAESLARKQLDDCRLYAPFSGVVSERTVEQGMNVMPGQSVLKLVVVDDVKVKLSVPEKEISHIAVGQDAIISVAALDGKTYEAKIAEKGVAANMLSHTYDVKLRLPNSDGQLLPGMVCNVSVVPSNGAHNVVLPASAVQLDSNNAKFVWVEKDGKAARKYVTTGSLSGNGIIILSGISHDDKVIVEGSQKVSEGMKVAEK